MTFVDDVHSRPHGTSVAIVVPVGSLGSIGTALVPSSVEQQEAA